MKHVFSLRMDLLLILRFRAKDSGYQHLSTMFPNVRPPYSKMHWRAFSNEAECNECSSILFREDKRNDREWADSITT